MTGQPRVPSSWLTDLRAAEEAATPGPWHVDGPWWHSDDDAAEMVSGKGDERVAVCLMPTKPHRRGRGTYEDARLIAAARNALPRLLAAAEAIERVRRTVEAWPFGDERVSEYAVARGQCKRAVIRALEGATDAD